MIEFQNVAFRYGNGAYVLKDLSFALPEGSCHFLTGPSGAGKTSLLRLLYLDHQPSLGTVQLFGRDTVGLKRKERMALRRRIGVVFQDFQLLEHLSITDNVALPLRIAGGREGEIREHVEELLRWVGLGHKLNVYPSELSGGEQQRIAIARAVINRPRLLVADEPTGNVDDQIAIRLLHLFVELNKLGTTVVIATHNQALLERFNSVPRLVLADGRLDILPGKVAA